MPDYLYPLPWGDLVLWELGSFVEMANVEGYKLDMTKLLCRLC